MFRRKFPEDQGRRQGCKVSDSANKQQPNASLKGMVQNKYSANKQQPNASLKGMVQNKFCIYSCIALPMIIFLLSCQFWPSALPQNEGQPKHAAVSDSNLRKNHQESNDSSDHLDESQEVVTEETPSLPTTPSKSIIKMREGTQPNSWKLVDWSNEPITPEEEEKFNCEMVTFQSAASGKEAQMCVHSFPDIVSGSIRSDKRWGDCNVLSTLWTTTVDNGKDAGKKQNSSKPVYVDIGANIGSCVMEMLIGTDADIIAFEPHPMNLYNLKKSILALDKSYQERLTLFPIGIGDVQGDSIIYSASNNMGNSVIGKAIEDYDAQEFDKKLQFTIHVEPLDSVLNAEVLDAKVMKMDAQGFECRILEGMGNDIARKIDLIKFEYAAHWLSAQDCTDILPRLNDYGFDIFRNGGSGGFSGKMVEPPQGATAKLRYVALDGTVRVQNLSIDLFASRRKD